MIEGNMASDEAVIKELKTVFDPEIGVNIVDLGLLYAIEQRDGKELHVKLTLTSPACPLGPQIMDEIKAKLAKLGFVVSIELTFAPPWGPDKMSEDAKLELGIV